MLQYNNMQGNNLPCNIITWLQVLSSSLDCTLLEVYFILFFSGSSYKKRVIKSAKEYLAYGTKHTYLLNGHCLQPWTTGAQVTHLPSQLSGAQVPTRSAPYAAGSPQQRAGGAWPLQGNALHRVFQSPSWKGDNTPARYELMAQVLNSDLTWRLNFSHDLLHAFC